MPISDLHAKTIVSVEATFGFSQFNCAPELISETLNIQADELRVRGQTRTTSSGKTIIVPFSTWWIESHVESKDVNDHLRDLLSRLAHVPRPFPAVFGEFGFGVVWKGNYLYAGSGPNYDADVVAGMARIGGTLGQDIYQIDDDTATDD